MLKALQDKAYRAIPLCHIEELSYFLPQCDDNGMLREREEIFNKSVDVTRDGVYSGAISTKQGKKDEQAKRTFPR